MTKLPTKTELRDFERDLGRLRTRLIRTSLGIRQLLHDALDHGYPHRASTVPTNPHNEVDENGKPVQASTQPEAAVINPDQTADAAKTLIKQIRDIHQKIRTLDQLIEAWDPERAVRHCPRCGHPYEPTQTRCQQYIDGKQCGTRENPERYCKGWPNAEACHHKGAPMPKGQPLRDDLCNACRLRKTRGNAIGTMADIHHQGDITGADQ